MKPRATFYAILCGLFVLGSWGAARIVFDSEPTNSEEVNTSREATSATPKHTIKPRAKSELKKPSDSADSLLANFNVVLESSSHQAVSEFINSHYSELDSNDLDQIRLALISKANSLESKQDIQTARKYWQIEIDIFNDLDAWKHLLNADLTLKDFPAALESLLMVTRLENDGQRLEQQLASLINVAANLRNSFEQRADEISINQLYQRLYDAQPNLPRIQLELAFSHLRLEQADKAATLLTQLQYDLELGDIAKQALANLDQSQSELPKPSPKPAVARNEVLIPLQRLGNSLVAELRVKQRNVRLLLDTGASITALDNRLVNQLGLEETGRSIRLSTANGVRQAKLYNSGRIQLGRFRIQNQVIAAIDLGANSRFAGLLGTDILNSLNQSHSFVIDNQRNALVFTPR